MKVLTFFLVLIAAAYGQINFDDYFEDKTLRLDYFHTGDKENDSYSFDELIEEPYWGGSKVNLIDKFNYGKYKFEVYDEESNQLIYSRGYSTIFNEWQTTEEAKHTTVKHVLHPTSKSVGTVPVISRISVPLVWKNFQVYAMQYQAIIKVMEETKILLVRVMVIS